MPFEPAPFPLEDHLGMTVASSAAGTGSAAAKVTSALLNPNGVVHGAVLFAMVDTAMGAATMSSLEEGWPAPRSRCIFASCARPRPGR